MVIVTVIEGNGYEARQTSERANRDSKICAHTLCIYYVTDMFLLNWLDPQYGVNNYCVLCMVKAKKTEQRHITKNFVGFHNHFPLLTKLWFNTSVLFFLIIRGSHYFQITHTRSFW